MSAQLSFKHDLVRQAVIRVAGLPDQDLRLVIEFADYLAEQRRSPAAVKTDAAIIREQAKQRAAQMTNMPREEAASRFAELIERMRRRAVERGSAIEGDWIGD